MKKVEETLGVYNAKNWMHFVSACSQVRLVQIH